MNAAARLVHQQGIAKHLILVHLLTRKQLGLLLIAASLVLSALAVIYVTHSSRELYAAYQHNVAEKNQLIVERGQLLLERGTWMMQARIQKYAESKLGMVLPDHKSVVIVRE
ncbi:MAG TPA: cell division protein FtsL [Gammaproteobacteria bacterium]|jgi:cell division protein FtsL|nr:cell division protein FtsL [Gammaproteobacteria bacterium]